MEFQLTNGQSAAAVAGKLAAAVVASVILYQLISAIYNVYFHPLSKFPGPASRAAFYVPDLWGIYNGNNHELIKELHDKYGDAVRVRPNQLSFSSAQAWKDIYGSRPGKGQLPKDPTFYTRPGEDRTNIIYSSDADHTRMRKLLSHAFSDAALRGQEPILTHYFDLLVKRLSSKATSGEPLDLVRWYNFFTFDVIGSLCFGEDFNALQSGEYHSWIRNIFQSVKLGTRIGIVRLYPAAFYLLRKVFALMPSLVKARDEHDKFTILKTSRRLEMETDRKDFMNYILRHNDERGMSRSEIENTAGVLIVAGSETTATLLSGATYLLLTNPHTYERAKEEVRSAFSKPEQMTLTSTAQLPYLHAVLEEALRLYPPVPSALPRNTGRQSSSIDGHLVPPNTVVAVPQWTVNMSKRDWAHPEVFAPERWLEKPPAEYMDDNKGVMNPFSFGPRNCIGKNLAYNEMRSVMARMLWHYEIELCPESARWRDQQTYIIWEKNPLKVRLSLVKR